MPEDEQRREILELTSTIVAAHVSNNSVPTADLPGVIATVHETLASLGTEEAPRPEPAVPIKKSVTPDYIICLEDGKKLKMLKRHLKTAHGMTPDEYRQRWGLPGDYPIVAPNYAAMRSKVAKKIGLGRKPGTKAKKSIKSKK